MMYAEDPRTPADRLCDAAPRYNRATPYRRPQRPSTAKHDTLLSVLLTAGEFTAEDIAERTGCWRSSVRQTITNHRDQFELLRPRYGNTPALWRAKRE